MLLFILLDKTINIINLKLFLIYDFLYSRKVLLLVGGLSVLNKYGKPKIFYQMQILRKS